MAKPLTCTHTVVSLVTADFPSYRRSVNHLIAAGLRQGNSVIVSIRLWSADRSDDLPVPPGTKARVSDTDSSARQINWYERDRGRAPSRYWRP